MNAKRAILL